MRTISEKWASFERAVLPSDCSDVQRSEMRKAFYAGAASLLALTDEIASIPNEDACIAILRGLHEEVQAFARKP
ncbi:MAG: hypothetical protein PW999_00690 [Paraburkholderia tropica]|nr:hypothetical protein [Paraburkholderia tropica]